VAAITEEANVDAIWPFERISARIKQMKNVFPIPLGAYKKYNPPDWLATVNMIVSNAIFFS